MAKLTRKLWVGIGVATLAGAASMPRDVAAQATEHKAHGKTPPTQNEGAATAKPGEGGEAYLTDGGPKDTRIRFYRDIELMRGHLLVGQQLIDMDLWDEALPHFLHPSEELYGLMEKYIKLHNMQPFGRELQALAQTVKARRKGAYEQALKPVHQRIEAALKVAKRFMRPERTFAIQSADRGAAHGAVRVRGRHGERRVHQAGGVSGQPRLRLARRARHRGRGEGPARSRSMRLRWRRCARRSPGSRRRGPRRCRRRSRCSTAARCRR